MHPVWSEEDALAAQSRYLHRATRLARDGFETPPEQANDLDGASAQIALHRVAATPAEKGHLEARQSALAKALDQARDRLAGRAQLAANQQKPDRPIFESTGVNMSDHALAPEEPHAKR